MTSYAILCNLPVRIPLFQGVIYMDWSITETVTSCNDPLKKLGLEKHLNPRN